MSKRLKPGQIAAIAGFGYLFFLAIELVSRGMKVSFASDVKQYLATSGASLGELSSFVLGVLATSLVQSSSTVTSMSVVLTKEGIIPLVVAIGVVHGANLGTSVTSSVVAFFSNVNASSGRLWADLRTMLFSPRESGFRPAVGTAVVHDMFNIIMITSILLVLELPFGLVVKSASASASAVATVLSSTSWLPQALSWVSPGTYTKPVSEALLALGVPGWGLAILGLPLLFAALKGFSSRMKAAVLTGVDDKDLHRVGDRLLGKTASATFVRGLVLTILVQSSSATTSMVVPLAAMGLFSVRKVFPFILGANIGTTTTAVLAASAAIGEPGFQVAMTVALSHLYLNCLAVLFAATIPGLLTSILGSADWLAARATLRPVTLLIYLAMLGIVTPAIVLTFPTMVAGLMLTALTLTMLIGPHFARYRARPGIVD